MTRSSLSKSRLARVREVMSGHVERGEVAGLVALVARGDETHVEAVGVQDLAGGALMHRETLFRIASMSKAITAVAAMILIEEARIALDDPVERWLPELANRRVLRSLDSAVDDTVPANRSITVRDLMTFRLGFGAVMAPPGTYPVQAAIVEAGFAPGPMTSTYTPDEWMKRFSTLPLLHQPGEKWMYHTGSDILGVLIARVTGQSFEDFLRARIFEPLGMKDTAFHAPADQTDRLATAYMIGPDGKLAVFDEARGGRFASPPAFQSGGGGLVSTIDDYQAFSRMLLNFGRAGSTRIISRPSVTLMTSDQITPEQKAASPFGPGFWDTYGWGFGVSVVTHRGAISETVGRYGWDGGFGTSWRADPAEDLSVILLMQRLFRGPNDTAIADDLLTLAYAAIDD
jgi:CubicO group peptidase (beta-lactamase class C family)